MAQSRLAAVYDELLEFLVEKATPQEILAFHASQTAQQRAEYLTERNQTDTLTPEETQELEEMLAFDLLVMALKAKALKLSSQN